jgi:cephalosporin hydroxylase
MSVYLTQKSQGRFVEYRERVKRGPEPGSSACGIAYFDLIQSQGTFECMQWKGLPLFKTVYDFSIYTMMLWRIRPRTIIELGSGTGASALWLADLATTFGFNSVIYSVDLVRPDLRHDSIRFIEGDCREIDRVFDAGLLQDLDHPLIFIEDAHVNVLGVLTHFHPYMSVHDYIVVEDSAGKQDDIGRFLLQTPRCYKVDTYYTDFFGRNATCAQDSFLVRV